MKVLAIIPARGGSRSIPLKNILSCAGKPLIFYSIDAALNSKLITRVIVSTDNPKIAQISKKLGAEIPFLRPKKFSGSKSSQLDVIIHTLNFLETYESYKPDIITILHPTQPLRTAQKIDKSIRLLKKTKADIILGVLKVKTHPYRTFWPKNNFLDPFRKDFLKFYQRQAFPTLYYPSGDIYTFWYKTYKDNGVIYGNKIFPLLPEKDEIIIDVDNLYDMFMVETTIKLWKSYKKKTNHKA